MVVGWVWLLSHILVFPKSKTHLPRSHKFSATLKTAKKTLENRNIQRSKILLLLRRSQRSLSSRHRNHESLHLPKHSSILALFRIEYLIPRELIRTSKGKMRLNCLRLTLCTRNNLQLGTKVPIPGVGDLDMNTCSSRSLSPFPFLSLSNRSVRKESEKSFSYMRQWMTSEEDKDAVWVNVPGSFTRGNLDGKRVLLLSFYRVLIY